MSDTTFDTLALRVEDGVAWIILNRPQRRNAFSDVMYAELIEVAQQVETRPDVQAVAITGEGSAFCAGGDIKGMHDRLAQHSTPDSRQWRYADVTTRVVQTLFGLSKPLVAVVNGPAVGGGACLALLADVRIASTRAWLSFPFISRALLPDWGATYLVPRAFGPSLGLDLLVTQRRIDAAEAGRLGVFAQVHEPDQLIDHATQLLHAITRAPQHPLRLLKQTLRQPEVGALVAAMRGEGAHQSRLTAEPDFAAAVGGFVGQAPAKATAPTLTRLERQ